MHGPMYIKKYNLPLNYCTVLNLANIKHNNAPHYKLLISSCYSSFLALNIPPVSSYEQSQAGLFP